jgi:TPR repeat protein
MSFRILTPTLAACVLAATVGSAAAEARDGFDAAEARAISAAINKDRRLSHMLRQCPADVFGKRRAAAGHPRAGSEAACDASLGECFRACVRGADGEACFRLAQTFQSHDEVVRPTYAQTLFTLACASGEGAGCTNRGAGIRNGDHAGDPFERKPERVQESCQYRSFKIACEQDDAWGCAMLGQSYEYGEGTRGNAALARTAYAKSCRLAPDFEACEFAKPRLDRLAKARD